MTEKIRIGVETILNSEEQELTFQKYIEYLLLMQFKIGFKGLITPVSKKQREQLSKDPSKDDLGAHFQVITSRKNKEPIQSSLEQLKEVTRTFFIN